MRDLIDWLQQSAIPPTYRLEPDRSVSAQVGQSWLATVSRVAYKMRRFDLVVRTTGVLLLRSGRLSFRKQPERTEELKAAPPDELVTRHRGNRFIPRERIADVRLREQRLGADREWRLSIKLDTGRTIRIVLRNAKQAQVARQGLQRLTGRRFGG